MIASTEYVTILFGVEGLGLGSDGLAFCNIHYGEMVFVYSWISTYWEVAWDIRDRKGDLSGYLDGDLLGFFPSLSGISTFSRDLEIDNSGVLFISIVWDINWAIVG